MEDSPGVGEGGDFVDGLGFVVAQVAFIEGEGPGPPAKVLAPPASL